jgi:hypothetical protein
MEKPEETKRPGFRVDDYLVIFPDIDNLIATHEDGSMSVLVDIYKVSKDNLTTEQVKPADLPPEVEEKIQTHIANMFETAIQEESMNNVKDQGS